MKDYKAIAKKDREIIYAYQGFTKWVLRHTQIQESQRGKDWLHAIDERESELAALESQEVEEVSAENEIKLLNETINNLHKAMVTAEKRGHDKAMEEYAQSSKVTDEMIERFMKSVIALHPTFQMDDPKQEECYLAYHDLKRQ